WLCCGNKCLATAHDCFRGLECRSNHHQWAERSGPSRIEHDSAAYRVTGDGGCFVSMFAALGYSWRGAGVDHRVQRDVSSCFVLVLTAAADHFVAMFATSMV